MFLKIVTELVFADTGSPFCWEAHLTHPPLGWGAAVNVEVEEGGGITCWAQRHCWGTVGKERWLWSPGGPPWWAEPLGSSLAEVSSLTALPARNTHNGICLRMAVQTFIKGSRLEYAKIPKSSPVVLKTAITWHTCKTVFSNYNKCAFNL